MAGELSEDELAFLQGVLDHAREGRTAELAEVIAKGVPVNLTGATFMVRDVVANIARNDGGPGVARGIETGTGCAAKTSSINLNRR